MLITRQAEFRAEADGLSGTILRYGDEATIGRVRERFEPGSIRFEDVILNIMHDRKQPVARTGTPYLTLQDGAERLEMSARYPDTIYGRRAQELVDAGILRGLSVEFIPVQERMQGGVRVISQAALHGVGLVDRPAYPQSTLNRDLVVPLQYRATSGLFAELLFNAPFIVSLAQRRKLEVAGLLELAEDIFLLDGYDYNRALASSAAGSMHVERTARGLQFFAPTRALRAAPLWTEVRKRLRANLINGITPGIMRLDSEEYVDDDGFTVERITRGAVCELNLVARRGAGFVSTGRRRMAPWQF